MPSGMTAHGHTTMPHRQIQRSLAINFNLDSYSMLSCEPEMRIRQVKQLRTHPTLREPSRPPNSEPRGE